MITILLKSFPIISFSVTLKVTQSYSVLRGGSLSVISFEEFLDALASSNCIILVLEDEEPL